MGAHGSLFWTSGWLSPLVSVTSHTYTYFPALLVPHLLFSSIHSTFELDRRMVPQHSLCFWNCDNDRIKPLLFEYVLGCFRPLSLADLGACLANAPQGSRFFHFAIHSFRKVTASGVNAFLRGRRPPPTANPRSATDYVEFSKRKYIDTFFTITSLTNYCKNMKGIWKELLSGTITLLQCNP